jgi:hypothetical protein
MTSRKQNDKLEVSSAQITNQLIEIKDRLGALETIASLANRKEVEAYVQEALKTHQAKRIMAFCEQPRTKEALRALMDLNSIPALDNHLKPLRTDDVLKQEINEDGLITFEWSNLFKRLPKRDRDRILGSQSASKKRAG